MSCICHLALGQEHFLRQRHETSLRVEVHLSAGDWDLVQIEVEPLQLQTHAAAAAAECLCNKPPYFEFVGHYKQE